jgi:hypothetical protein
MMWLVCKPEFKRNILEQGIDLPAGQALAAFLSALWIQK